MFVYHFIFFIIMVSGFLVFCSMRKHILLTLLSLEFMVLGLYFMFFSFLIDYMNMSYFILVFLTFTVCEGALGLGILVSMIRGHGNDSVASLSFVSW
uniref:NADH-ubiquinone oxidoreductase chain 4L n=1 Tax=Carcinochelis bannaensis TaxID=2126074 RepID=A0A343W8P6_9HEMI|nr:NADH dehydrogenase subunit 4L [Carcinochelis bannaensis]AVZ00736.1 NADH dehydrogenase subunit 4L [Carcinochelis bannaensis]